MKGFTIFRLITLFCSLVFSAGSLLYVSSTQLSGAEESYVIAQQEIPFSYTLTGIVQAEETTPIKNPVSWKPVKHVVADGSYIKKDEIIAEFDPLYQDMQYEKMLIQKNVVDLELESKLIDIDEKSQKFEDQIKSKHGSLKVLLAKLKRLKSLPLQSDVTIAKGKLRVANLELEAAESEWVRAQDRYTKNFLSKTELQRYRYSLERKQIEQKHALESLAIIDRPADVWDVESLELQIKNVQLDIEKLEFEYSKQKEFITINKNSAQQGVKHFERRLKSSKEELEKLVVRSPIDGYVVYTDDFKRAVADNGGKMWRRRVFVNIPHVDGMYIHATIPEHLRQLISEGDRCDIYMPGIESAYVLGEVSEIDNQPQDIMSANGEHSWGSHDKNSGIKVYVMRIKPSGDVPPALKPQSHVQVVVYGKDNLATAVPAHYVVCKDENYYVSIDGIYEKVEGASINGWFQFKDDSLLGKEISLKGEFPINASDDNIVENSGGKLVLSGEVSAVREQSVRVQDIHRSAKVVELVEEGVFVEKGQQLIRLDDTDTKEELTKREEDWKNKTAEREREEEQIKITTVTGEIDVKHAQNNVLIAELALNKIKERKNEKSLLDSRRRLRLAQISLNESASVLERLRALPKDRVSRTELIKAERDHKRKTLLMEQADIQLTIVEKGVDYLALKTAEKNLLVKRLDLENLKNRLAYSLEVANGGLIRTRNRENHAKERYDHKNKELNNLVITAPVAGIVQYKVIYDSGSLGKIKKGSTLRQHLSPVSIADFDQTMVSLEVPEQAFTHIKEGSEVKVLIPSLGDHEFKGLVKTIDYIFKNKTRKDINIGLYANREPLGQSVFVAHIYLEVEDKELVKPGMQVHVHFPIDWPLNARVGGNDVN